MFQAFFGPKVLKEPKTLWRVGRLDDYSIPGVYEKLQAHARRQRRILDRQPLAR
jgi:hypothetical protein